VGIKKTDFMNGMAASIPQILSSCNFPINPVLTGIVIPKYVKSSHTHTCMHCILVLKETAFIDIVP
jgi:hypothetical protein